MKRFRRYMARLFVSDELPFETRILNTVCFLGTLAAIVSLVARVVEGMPALAIWTMVFIVVAVVALFVESARHAGDAGALTAIVLYSLGIVIWPLVFFASGGTDSGMAAYFALVIILDFLLLKGSVRVVCIILTAGATLLCYTSALFWGWELLPSGGLDTTQRYIDLVQSIFVTGFFMGTVIVFQNKVYLKEKSKAESAGANSERNEELLKLVNKAASLLLTTQPEMFEAAMAESMEILANSQGFDRVYVWRLDERDGQPVYVQLYGWISPASAHIHTVMSYYGANWIPRIPQWEEYFEKREFIADATTAFSGLVREQLDNCGITSIMAFPVFLQDKYWGFVSFDNCFNEVLCSEQESAILQSSSLLLANAVQRNENTRLLSERLAQQQLMSNISRSFISKEPIVNHIRDALAQVGAFMRVERVVVAVFDKNADISRIAYFWVSDPKYAPETKQGFSSIMKDLLPRYQHDNEDLTSIYCENTITYKNGMFKPFSDIGGIKSFICAPIYVDGELWGVLSIEERDDFRSWSESDAQLASSVSSAISNAVARDIIEKERTAALEQAIKASRAKSDFLSNMSHEMRTPMNAIIGMTSIGMGAQTIEKKDGAFKKIDNASKHLLGVINDILDMSKIEANMLELSPISFDFERMLQKVVSVISFRIDERQQQFYVSIDRNIPQVLLGDDQRLAQVVANLLSNAAKFTPEGGSIHLCASLLSENDGVCRMQIDVADTGIGISDEQKSRLFHSFEQAEAGTSRKFGGTGLGLAISKRIVELMGGEIWVQSESGRGSVFSFTFQLRRDSNACKPLLMEGINWDNIRIFAVDDDPEIREFFASMADRLGIACDVASSGEEAAEMLAADDGYNIFFLDWKLPGMNGIELARQINAKQGAKSVVIIFSAAEWSFIENEAHAAGVSKFLPKPLFPSSIVDLINQCLGLASIKETAENNDEPDDFSGCSLLLAEDVDINREIVSSLLEPTKLSIDYAENGAQAVQMFSAAPEKYDMIFMDVQMPEMDGYEATRHIRSLDLPNAATIPIVAMTANVFREDIELCLAAGMNAHVGKPLDLKEVLAALREYLGVGARG